MAAKTQLLLTHHRSPGDVLMLTAAVRDLRAATRDGFDIAVQTNCMPLWDHNPHLSPPRADATVIPCDYKFNIERTPLPRHFVTAFHEMLELSLGSKIPLTAFHGDIHLSAAELAAPRQIAEPYWIMVCGGNWWATTKWWNPAHAQAVVDHFRGQITFAQCGRAGDHHPRLRDTIDMVGRTTLREFVQLMYHCDGVVCPITFAMHLAAAMPARPGGPLKLPCVVTAGGRESPHWEMYPWHTYLHSIGQLPCCATRACWKTRAQQVFDGLPYDADLCEQPVALPAGGVIARCLHDIRPEHVIAAIDNYRRPVIL